MATKLDEFPSKSSGRQFIRGRSCLPDINDMERPRGRFYILGSFCCPMCRIPFGKRSTNRHKLRYGRNSVRIECGNCGMRFSIDPAQAADCIEAHPDLYARSDLFHDFPDKDVEELRDLDAWNKHLAPKVKFHRPR